MRQLLKTLFLPLILALPFAGVSSAAEPFVVQVSPSGFSLLWQAPHGALPGVSVFSDEAGTTEITSDLRVEVFPLHTGNRYLPNGYAARGERRMLERRMSESGVMLLRVSGCLPDTVYYFQGEETPIGDGTARVLPASGPLPSVQTAVETGLVSDSRQLLVEFSRNDLAGRTLLLQTDASPHGLVAVVGDGAASNQAFFNLDDLLNADGKITGGLTGENDFTLAMFGELDSSPIHETTLAFSGTFEVADAEVFTFGMDSVPVTVAGFAFDRIEPQTVGMPFTVTIRAVDSIGRTLPRFEDSVELTSTGTLGAGGGATPAFVKGVLASYLVTVTDPGEHRLSATSEDGDLGASALFTVSTAYNFWKLVTFPNVSDREDPSISGHAADPDGSGVPNLLRYALHLEGENPRPDGLPAAGMETLGNGDSHLTLSYRRAKGTTDLFYLVEVGGNLHGWESGPNHTEVVRVEDRGVWEMVTVRDRTPLAGPQSRFMRLRVGISATFAGWQAEQIAGGGESNPSAYLPGAASPIDGIPNLIRYALGLDPDEYQRHMLPAYGHVDMKGERYISLTYNRPKDRTDVDYIVEVSRNMIDWFSGPDYTAEVSVIDAGANETVTIRDRTSVTTADRRVIRLKVVQH